MFVGATIYSPCHSSCAGQEGNHRQMDDELSAAFDLIHAELDALPPTEWSLVEARRVLATLSQLRRARNPVLNLGCVASPRLRRRLGT